MKQGKYDCMHWVRILNTKINCNVYIKTLKFKPLKAFISVRSRTTEQPSLFRVNSCLYQLELKTPTMSMIPFGLFLVMRITLARYYLVEIQDDVVGGNAGRGGISNQFRNRSTDDIFLFECNIIVTYMDCYNS